MSVIVTFIVEMTNGIFRSQSRALLDFFNAMLQYVSMFTICKPSTDILILFQNFNEVIRMLTILFNDFVILALHFYNVCL